MSVKTYTNKKYRTTSLHTQKINPIWLFCASVVNTRFVPIGNRREHANFTPMPRLVCHCFTTALKPLKLSIQPHYYYNYSWELSFHTALYTMEHPSISWGTPRSEILSPPQSSAVRQGYKHPMMTPRSRPYTAHARTHQNQPTIAIVYLTSPI